MMTMGTTMTAPTMTTVAQTTMTTTVAHLAAPVDPHTCTGATLAQRGSALPAGTCVWTQPRGALVQRERIPSSAPRALVAPEARVGTRMVCAPPTRTTCTTGVHMTPSSATRTRCHCLHATCAHRALWEQADHARIPTAACATTFSQAPRCVPWERKSARHSTVPYPLRHPRPCAPRHPAFPAPLARADRPPVECAGPTTLARRCVLRARLRATRSPPRVDRGGRLMQRAAKRPCTMVQTPTLCS